MVTTVLNTTWEASGEAKFSPHTDFLVVVVTIDKTLMIRSVFIFFFLGKYFENPPKICHVSSLVWQKLECLQQVK